MNSGHTFFYLPAGSARGTFAIVALAASFCFFRQGETMAGELPPERPLAATPAASCAWTIDVFQKHPLRPPSDDPRQAAAYKRASAAFPRPTRVTVEKAGGNMHRETFLENGKVDVLWIYNGWVIYRPSTFPEDRPLAMPVNARNSPVKGDSGVDFPDLSWLQPKAFVKTVDYHGQRCDYYEDKNASPLAGGDTLNPVASKGVWAWIDVKTRLPVVVEDNALRKTFHFSSEPSGHLQLTGVFATAYENATRSAESPAESSPHE